MFNLGKKNELDFSSQLISTVNLTVASLSLK